MWVIRISPHLKCLCPYFVNNDPDSTIFSTKWALCRRVFCVKSCFPKALLFLKDNQVGGIGFPALQQKIKTFVWGLEI